ncbi:hypothetical protein F4804DRAFT_241189 [Jackrogersella minutella]|nr:hypothetical protein F4804DRAFT_241189 [Jackrogersella minutella]
MLSAYLQSESRRWAARHHQESYPASTSQNNTSSLSDCEDSSDCESVFSRTSSSSRSRRSSVSSVASEDQEPPAALDQPRDFNGAPITMYASLDQAVAQTTQTLEAEGPRRLVTPGKLYENEEDDDEIMEDDVVVVAEKYSDITSQHHQGGFSHTVASNVAAAG